MKELWARFGSKGIGLEEDSVELLTQELSGLDLNGFFNQVVRGTGELPLTEMLESFGVKLSRRKPETSKDLGGKKGTGKFLPSLDIIVASASDGAKVKVVHDNGAAQKAGLSAGDTIIALDGIKLTSQNLEKRLGRYQVGEEVLLHVFRRDELFERKVVLGEDRDFVHYFELIDDCSDDVKKRRAKWLQGV
jgi:predicted metalloprotease with PDZ domain